MCEDVGRSFEMGDFRVVFPGVHCVWFVGWDGESMEIIEINRDDRGPRHSITVSPLISPIVHLWLATKKQHMSVVCC